MAETLLEEKAKDAAFDSATYVKVEGAGGTGKTEFLVQRVKCLLKRDIDPAQIRVLASTRSGADALQDRIRRLGGAAENVSVGVLVDWCCELLSSPQAKEATGRVPRLLADFEERILLEDLKVLGIKPKRLREMLKFFYREWCEVGDERDDFIIDLEEKQVHDGIKSRLVQRGGMLRQELSNVSYKFARDHAPLAERHRCDYVFVDDFQNLNKASQLLVDLLARKSLTVLGNANEQVKTTEPYPNPLGFENFEQDHEGALCVSLHRNARCARRFASMANSLVKQGGFDADLVSSENAENLAEGEARFVRWTFPNDEFKGIARFVKHRLAQARPLHARDVFVAVPNRLWGRALAKILRANNIAVDVLTDYHALMGDPRSWDKCAGLRAFCGLNLIADPEDAVAWRCWCGFGDYLTRSNHWDRLEEYAQSRGLAPTEALDEISSLADEAFVGAGELTEAYLRGKRLVSQGANASGYALLGLLKDAGSDTLPADFLALVEPVEGPEDAPTLLKRAKGRMENKFANVDAVRIGLIDTPCGMSFDTVIIMGAVEGFYPAAKTLGPECDPDIRDQIQLAERRSWYSAMVKSRNTLVISTIAKDESNTAAALGMRAHRIRKENGKSLAILSPSCYLDELGDDAPGFEASI